jgi:NAD(P)-dependent dehydrogenase (short-subunit alcohol dehydrogenase family)
MSDARIGVVTGAGRGMGLACARRIAPTVDTLVLIDRDQQSLAQVSDELARDAEIVPMTADVADPTAMTALATRVKRGTLRAVAHAAGVSPTMASWRDVVRVDLIGTALIVDALSPFVTAGTAAVCFASMSAALLGSGVDPAVDAALDDPLHATFLDDLLRAAGPGIEQPGLAYALAKRGVQRLVRRAAVDWGARRGRICSISPGMIDTPQGRQEAAAQPFMAVLLERTPLARLGTADEVAAVVSFLLSDEAAFVTGIDVLVDGGVCAAFVPSASGPDAA